MAHKVLNLDLSKDPRGNPIVYGRVGDSDSQIVTVNVTGKLNKRDLSEYTIAFEGETSGGKTKVIDSENIISTPEGLKQGTFDYLFPNKAFAVAGEYKRAYFSFTNGNSRDTTGNFKLVVLKNADLTAEEAETVISEYNKLIEELRELQKIAIDEMDQNFTAAQERIAELEVEITQALEAFEKGNFYTKDETLNKEGIFANVIYQLVGKEKVRIKYTIDFKDKVAESNDVPHVAKRTAGGQSAPTDVLKPDSFPNDFDTPRYKSIWKLDNNYSALSANNVGGISQELFEYDVYEVIRQSLGEDFFIDRGANDVASRVEVIKGLIVGDTFANVYGFGSSAGGNTLTAKCYSGTNWYYTTGTTSGAVTKIYSKIPQIDIKNYISSSGKFKQIAFAEPSDGAIASTINIDYVSLVIEIEISAHDHIKSMIAQYCIPFVDQITDLTKRVSALEGQ